MRLNFRDWNGFEGIEMSLEQEKLNYLVLEANYA